MFAEPGKKDESFSLFAVTSLRQFKGGGKQPHPRRSSKQHKKKDGLFTEMQSDQDLKERLKKQRDASPAISPKKEPRMSTGSLVAPFYEKKRVS